ncbi:hypothetical protein LptCag_1129 [Leptospirillum ferriphilum]|uniref:Uncharacterized protein n=1 Tax=Leptospirillum ferriphilum TaxID=178606 RepID=A0A094YM98_9BACT|nr:hypothetical protein LptCag_1129 [Leptospirillum ferriphilum]
MDPDARRDTPPSLRTPGTDPIQPCSSKKVCLSGGHLVASCPFHGTTRERR